MSTSKTVTNLTENQVNLNLTEIRMGGYVFYIRSHRATVLKYRIISLQFLAKKKSKNKTVVSTLKVLSHFQSTREEHTHYISEATVESARPALRHLLFSQDLQWAYLFTQPCLHFHTFPTNIE